MNTTAVITGASGGIGEHLAYEAAKAGYNVILVARTESDLERVAEVIETKYNVQAYILVLDLINPDSIANIKAFVAQQQLVIDCLINNAGFGYYGNFYEQDLAKCTAMIDLNIQALTALTHAFLPTMVQNGNGKILQVASTAGFVPGPFQAVYFASKAYVLSFSEAIAEELHGTGVTVTALCPGPVATKFASAAKMSGAKMFKNGQDPATTARIGFTAMQQGKRVVITQTLLSIGVRFFIHFVPRTWRTKVVKKMQQQ